MDEADPSRDINIFVRERTATHILTLDVNGYPLESSELQLAIAKRFANSQFSTMVGAGRLQMTC